MSGPYGKQNRDLIGQSLYIRGKNVLNPSASLDVNSVTTKKVDVTGQIIEFTKVIGPNYCPCVIQNWTAEANVSAYTILKVGSGDFTATPVLSSDSEETGVIGISINDATADGIVKVCTSGIFSIAIEDGTSVTAGDTIKRSSSDDGKAEPDSSSIGTFGIVLESAPSSTPGPIVKAMFIKNENY